MRRNYRDDSFHIQHVGNSLHEYFDSKATCSYVDGYSSYDHLETIYEFLGCFWHGCPRCFREEVVEKPETKHPRRNLAWGIIYEKPKIKSNY